MQQPLPKSVTDFKGKYPAVWDAFATLGDRCHQAGPLDEKTRRLVKLGIAIAHRHEGAVHSATRNALRSGIAAEEMFHVAILATTTIGWPPAYAAMTWIEDAVSGSRRQPFLEVLEARQTLHDYRRRVREQRYVELFTTIRLFRNGGVP